MKADEQPPLETEILRGIDNSSASKIILLSVQVPYCSTEEHPVYGQHFFTQKGAEEYEAVKKGVELDSRSATEFYAWVSNQGLGGTKKIPGTLKGVMQDYPSYFDASNDQSIFSTHVVESLLEIADDRLWVSFLHPAMMNYAERTAKNLIRKYFGNNAVR